MPLSEEEDCVYVWFCTYCILNSWHNLWNIEGSLEPGRLKSMAVPESNAAERLSTGTCCMLYLDLDKYLGRQGMKFQ